MSHLAKQDEPAQAQQKPEALKTEDEVQSANERLQRQQHERKPSWLLHLTHPLVCVRTSTLPHFSIDDFRQACCPSLTSKYPPLQSYDDARTVPSSHLPALPDHPFFTP
eukprot:6188379-Pleurochrysis_carterae.AAC.5